jgi:glycosidase
VWSDDKDEFAKNPFQWHQVRDEKGQKTEGERYYGLLWWEMPSLNLDDQNVREEFLQIGKFWLQDVGVDGFRIDAAEHIYPPDQTHKTLLWWKEFHQEMLKINPDVILAGEVMGGSEKTSPFLKSGFNSTFNFELADTIMKSVLKGEDLGIVKTYNKINSVYSSMNPDYADDIFLTNHDMDRVMTQFSRNNNMAKLAAGLLLTLPGNPFIYYGEEIGMLGEKPDEYIREPFVWNVEGEDEGQTNWEIPYASSSRTVKPLFYQIDDHSSVFNYYKSLIKLRNENPALSKGQLIGIETSNPKVLSYYRISEDQEAIVIINFSSEMERIPTLRGLDGFEMGFKNFNVFKINDREISLQPYAIFILTRSSQYMR